MHVLSNKQVISLLADEQVIFSSLPLHSDQVEMATWRLHTCSAGLVLALESLENRDIREIIGRHVTMMPRLKGSNVTIFLLTKYHLSKFIACENIQDCTSMAVF